MLLFSGGAQKVQHVNLVQTRLLRPSTAPREQLRVGSTRSSRLKADATEAAIRRGDFWFSEARELQDKLTRARMSQTAPLKQLQHAESLLLSAVSI